MKRILRLLPWTLVLALWTVPQDTWAQSGAAGQVELGSFGTFTKYEDTGGAGLDQEFGAGGRLGFFFSRVFALEASGDYTRTRLATGEQVNVTRLGGSLIAYGHLLPWNAFYLGAGYERVFNRGAMSGDANGAHVLLGDRLSLGGRAAFRVEARASFFPPGTLRNVNLSSTFGLSVFAFGGPPRDSDKDGVGNDIDRCPGTPLGASVDPDGCPIDEDQDGVFDGLDACPGTPFGAVVDAAGCPSDADSDGVFDGVDACPETPRGVHVDERGCPVDTDSDGVFDGIDLCPDTPVGAEVDGDGCPLDTDRDGVYDGLDQCPGTPLGVEVNETGCPNEKDTDGDGVLDSKDRCPNTAPGRNVDAFGCPVLFVIEQGQFVTEDTRGPLILRGVAFAVSRSVLTPESHAILDQVAASLVQYPEVMIEIGGHTDATGTDRINNALSANRARAVMAYLAQKGVRIERMTAQGYGSTQPIATNRTRAGRQQNRRVELKVIRGGQ